MASSGSQIWNILVVDDEPLVSKSIQMLLQFDGHKVSAVSNGEEALALLDQYQYDLVIMDFTMPGMNGDELALVVKERFPHQPILMTTAHAEGIHMHGQPLTGVDYLMGKPFSRKELRDAISQTLSPSS